ncbi:type II CRISPR RNA-guided endonuclease Cas9 [Caldimonas thermodepolymerans]|nr:type II CRISPR RNA-guided endonuclease Cas9 [Caldimonas thermodepolymerans]UZG48663.1 type II CRISPR RNA-guided endonuclease Cas9 [Caldimonas thermodepolymerans]
MQKDFPTDKPQQSMNTLTFGFDIGIASVGWAVLAENRIVDLGVRAFDKAETPDRGEPLNAARRAARLTRRRLFRRAWRLTKLARLLKREGLIPDVHFFKSQPGFRDSPWMLRKEGLDRQLSPVEWARVLYHLCKHRGFHWLSKAEEARADQDAEGGRVKKALMHTQALMNDKGYRTAAEMVLSEFDTCRNKQGSYDKALSRALLDEELGRLFEAQRQLGNPHASAELERAIRGTGDRRSGLFWEQRPPQSVLSMLGRCRYERTGGPDGKGEYRAPKASFTAERHVWLTRLNNLRIVVDGEIRPLTDRERQRVLDDPYRAAERYTYKSLRKALLRDGELTHDFRFAGLSYPSEQQKVDQKVKDPEDQILVRLTGWHTLRLHLKNSCLATEWQILADDALSGKPDQLDQIAWALSVFKSDDEVRAELSRLALPGGERMVEALLSLNFDKFHALSLKALRKIVPLMEQGLRYDEAVERIPEYGHHSNRPRENTGKQKYLPPFYEGTRTESGSMRIREGLDIPRNPVVLRALNQARKVCNALIREYGQPSEVHIEMARDLARPADERRAIQKLQEEYRERNEAERLQFAETFGRKPSGAELEKWLLYREQHGKCAYSLEPLDLARVIKDPGYVQVDHALPYSRSFDDSRNNKVLVLTRENQNKGNRTPYEYLTSFPGGEEGDRWRHYKAWVEANKSYRQAKRNRLLRKHFGAEEEQAFKDRNLNDTRYICRFFKNYVEEHLQLASDSTARRCVVLNGQLTAFLRAKWGLLKIREQSDRHHALDAAVIAACSHAMVKRLADYARKKELAYLSKGLPDPETGVVASASAHDALSHAFPEPWPHFRHELEKRLTIESVDELRSEMKRLGTYPPEALESLRPLFVSRAPQRRGVGALHKDTLYSPRPLLEKNSEPGKQKNCTIVRKNVLELKLSDLQNIVGKEDPRNASLIKAIEDRLVAHGNDGKKAFATPLFRPSADGKKAPIVRTVRLYKTKETGAFVGTGVADLGEMLRVDVFRHERRYVLIPAYAMPLDKRINKNQPPDGAEFLFSLTKNDLVEVTIGSTTTRGYFVMFESDGRLTLRRHDQPIPDRSYFRKNIANATRLQKFHVDILGRVFLAPPEKRYGVA